jgi:hypothetical protein
MRPYPENDLQALSTTKKPVSGRQPETGLQLSKTVAARLLGMEYLISKTSGITDINGHGKFTSALA